MGRKEFTSYIQGATRASAGEHLEISQEGEVTLHKNFAAQGVPLSQEERQDHAKKGTSAVLKEAK